MSALLDPEDPAATAASPVLIDSLLLIDFAAGGNCAPYLGIGWSSPEARLSWALGPRSTLRLPAPWDRRPRLLEFEVNPCRSPPHITGQMLGVSVNGHFFGAHLLTQRAILRCALAPEVWQGRDILEIAFEHPNFLIPRRLRQSADGRPLAVAFFSARLYSRHAPRAPLSLPALPPATVEPLALAELPPAEPPLPASPEAQPEIYPFGFQQPGSALVRDGFALAEPHFQWTNAPVARVRVPAPETSGAHLLRLTGIAFTRPPKLAAQELSVSLGGRLLAHLTAVQAVTFGLPLPTEAPLWTEPLDLAFHLPTAVPPAELGDSVDPRRLGFCMHSLAIEPLPPALAGWAGRRVDEAAPPADPPRVADRFCAVPEADLPAAVAAELGRDPAALLRDFESLGENCELGLAQRKYGAEVLGLFRFGFVPLDKLLLGFADGFAGLADPDSVTVTLSDYERPEFIVAADAYGMRWHTFVFGDQGDAETTRREQARKLGFVRRKFLETLRASRKIFVLKRERPLALAEVLPVLLELNRHARNTLLYVVPGAAPERNGAVEALGPGLLRGHLAAFAPYDNVFQVNASDWLRLCANAWTLCEHAASAEATGEADTEADAPAPEPAAAPPPIAVAPAPDAAPILVPEAAPPVVLPEPAEAAPVAAAEPGPALPSPAAMLRACESLGETSEFGIVQRRAGLEVLSLFRFAETPLAGLLAGFADEFADLGTAAALSIALNDAKRPEYVLAAERYGMRWPTQVHADEADAATTLQRQAMKLGYLRRKFLEALRGPGRIFVLRRDQPLSEVEVAPLAEALARYGHHTLLYIVPDGGDDGAVSEVAPGVLRGCLGTGMADLDAWLMLIANAWTLHAAHIGAGAAA